MKNNTSYNPKNLFIGNLCWFPNEFDFLDVGDINITNQKYIFEKINETEYREVLTGLTMIEWPEFSSPNRVPYIVDLKSIFEYIPVLSLKESVDSVDLLIALDIINASSRKEQTNTNQKKLVLDYLLVPKNS